jgi:tetratricopeptide (TPR) repeat protein
MGKIESYLLRSGMLMNYQYDGQTLAAPVDGRLIKLAIDEAVLVRQDADATAAGAIADGDVLVGQGNFEEAMKLYRDSLAIRERLMKADPANIARQRGLWVAHDRIGVLLRKQANLGEALKSCRDGLAIAERLVKTDPGNEAQRDLLVSYEHVGDVLQAQCNLNEALKLYRDGLAIAERLAETDARNTQSQDLQIAVSKIGGLAWTFVLAGKFSQAIDAIDQAVSAAPDLIWLYANRAYALMFLGEVDEARAIYLRYRHHEKIQGEKSWDAVVLEDFVELRKAGSHPLMDEIEKVFSAKV